MLLQNTAETAAALASVRAEIALTEESITESQQEQSNRDKEMAFRIRLEEIDLECMECVQIVHFETELIPSPIC